MTLITIRSLRGSMKSLLIMLWHQIEQDVLTEILHLSRYQLNIVYFNSKVPTYIRGTMGVVLRDIWLQYESRDCVNKSNFGSGAEPGTSWQELVIETVERPGRQIDTQEGVGRDLGIHGLFWFGMGGETLSCWVFGKKGRSTGPLLASLI